MADKRWIRPEAAFSRSVNCLSVAYYGLHQRWPSGLRKITIILADVYARETPFGRCALY